jgi:DNA-binding transcriptional LysR family regulator
MRHRDWYLHVLECRRVAEDRLHRAARAGRPRAELQQYEQDVAEAGQERATAVAEWMKAAGGRLPDRQLVANDDDLRYLAAALERHGATLVTTSRADPVGLRLVRLRFSSDPAETLACLDVIAEWNGGEAPAVSAVYAG